MVINSTIRGPVVIGAGTRIVEQLHRPVHGDRRRLRVVDGSEVEHSVVMDGSSIIDIARLEDSLIGSRGHRVSAASSGRGRCA